MPDEKVEDLVLKRWKWVLMVLIIRISKFIRWFRISKSSKFVDTEITVSRIHVLPEYENQEEKRKRIKVKETKKNTYNIQN